MERIDQFFSCYFHQDWSDEASSWRTVVAQYRAEVGGDEARLVAKEIELLAEHHSDDESLEVKVKQLGCYYWPGSPSLYRAWLTEVATQSGQF